MNVLIVGGRGQGKCGFAMRAYGLSETDFADGETCTFAELSAAKSLSGLHRLTRRVLAGGQALDDLPALLEGKIVLCDEIGCGVVPIDRAADDWREQTGRLCCALAARADEVWRVHAGLAQKIK